MYFSIRIMRRVGLGPPRKSQGRIARFATALIAVLLAAGCAPLPPKLSLPQLSVTDPAFQTTLEAFTGARISGDNIVDILLNGDETFPVLLDALRAAKKTITFEAFIFRKSKIGDEIVAVFEERCRAGIRASILLDAHGSDNLPEDYVERLNAAGCRIVA